MKHIVVLTGAGISAESGLKTFRDSDGLWMGYNIEDVATAQAFQKNPQLVLDFYNMRRRDVAVAKPNNAHTGLVKLEKNYQVSIITQNIDDLHERAGSTNVLHLHGEIFKMQSVANSNLHFEIRKEINVGDLAKDGSQLRPHIVWFGEAVPMMEKAIALVNNCDILVIIGTSLQVYPAASLLQFAAPYIPKYIIDKKLPSVSGYHNLHAIEKPATEGIEEILKILS